MKVTKKLYVILFFAIVIVLAVVKSVFVKGEGTSSDNSTEKSYTSFPNSTASRKHPIRSVPNYLTSFPDSQAVQIVAANKWGVKPVQNREDAESRKRELPCGSSVLFDSLSRASCSPAVTGHRTGVL